MKQIKILTLSIIGLGALLLFSQLTLAQETVETIPTETEVNQTTSAEAMEDETVTAQDLEVTEPKILPNSPFYFLKEAWRTAKETLTFDPVAKLELKEKLISERLLELQKLNEQKGVSKETLQKTINKYSQEAEKLKNKALELKQKATDNPKINSFLNKYTKQETLHGRILEKLEEKVPPEVLVKIKEQREQHLERFKDVMLKLEDKTKIKDRMENVLEKIKGSEFKDFKNSEFIDRIKDKMPDDIKPQMESLKEKMLESVQKKMEQASPEKLQKLENYIKQIPGEPIRQIRALEQMKEKIQDVNLKERLENTRGKMIEKLLIRPGAPIRQQTEPAEPTEIE